MNCGIEIHTTQAARRLQLTSILLIPGLPNDARSGFRHFFPESAYCINRRDGTQCGEHPSLPLNCFAASQPRVAAEVLEDVAQVYRHGDRQNTSLVPDRSRWIPRASGHEGPASEEAGKFNISLTHRTSRVAGLSIVWMRSATRSDCPSACPASAASR